jgi:hypothetical protein
MTHKLYDVPEHGPPWKSKLPVDYYSSMDTNGTLWADKERKSTPCTISVTKLFPDIGSEVDVVPEVFVLRIAP